MAEPAMILGENELKRIGDYVKGNLKEWIREIEPQRAADPVTNTMLMERIVRLEERFVRVDDRFDFIAERFRASDKRFDELQASMDKRFEVAQASMDTRFEGVNSRFEDVNRRFDDVRHHMDKRFGLLTWMVGVTFTAVIAVVGILVAA